MGPEEVAAAFHVNAGPGEPATGTLGIAARAVELDQMHCGLVYRKNGDYRFLHLGQALAHAILSSMPEHE